MKRIVCWFSCGAASAVATKIAIEKNKERENPLPIVIVYTKVAEEHPDNERFMKDCEAWFGQRIVQLINEKYNGSIVNVFDSVRYMGGVAGAPCTLHLKKDVRRSFEMNGDINVFGYTVEEQHRVDRWIDANAESIIWAVLVEQGLSHEDCLAIVNKAGIELPAMYKLGYKNNNCIGCVKGGAGYWNKIRKDFPDVFYKRAEQEERIGAHLIRHNGRRITLRELPPDAGRYGDEPEVQCGIMCELVSRELI